MSSLREIGQTLREAREREGKTLEQMAADTHIHLRHLQALEEGDETALPEPFYIKFFIRKYASILKLNGDELATTYWDTRPLTPLPEPTPERGMPDWLLPGMASLLVLVLFGVIWYLVVTHRHPAKLAASAPATYPPIAMAAGPMASPSAQVTARLGTKSKPKAAVKPSGKTRPTPTSTNSVAIAAPPGSLALTVEATADSWVQLTVDGHPAYADVLRAGQSRSVQGHQVEAVVGNAGSTRILVNGKDQGTLGKTHEVVDKVFTATATHS